MKKSEIEKNWNNEKEGCSYHQKECIWCNQIYELTQIVNHEKECN
jgi:hypothetical protein